MSSEGSGSAAERDGAGRFVSKQEGGSDRELALSQAVLSTEEKETLRVAEEERVARVEALALERLAVRARLVEKQRAANDAAAAADLEHAIMCVIIDETSYETWVTQTLLVAFMKIWESVPSVD